MQLGFDRARALWQLTAPARRPSRRIPMPKAEWGVKRACASCGARFYDLLKDPIICPDCGATFVIETAKAARRRAAEPAAAKQVDVEDADLVEDDADVLDADDSDDDDDVGVEAGAGSSDDDDDDALEADDSVLLDDEEDDADLSEFGEESDDEDRR
jgi:uncharacterized protein (TIGR02300 family)